VNRAPAAPECERRGGGLEKMTAGGRGEGGVDGEGKRRWRGWPPEGRI
jgi:hypothetical protein